jgi:DNA sulfur modification protein DndE
MSTFTHIKTSEANKAIVTDLTRKLNLGPENVIARLAFAYSLSKDKRFDLKNIQDAKGKEYNKNVLFGNNLPYYIALICTHYHLYKTDKDIPRYIKMHIDDGLELMDRELRSNPNLTGFDFLVSKIESGLKHLE